MASRAYPSDQEAAKTLLLNKLGNELEKVEGDYAQLVRPQTHLNNFLIADDLITLRHLRVSWQGKQIQFLLKEEIKKMKEAGVELAEGPHGIIIFRRITAK